jgi:hypothetical protein
MAPSKSHSLECRGDLWEIIQVDALATQACHVKRHAPFTNQHGYWCCVGWLRIQRFKLRRYWFDIQINN